MSAIGIAELTGRLEWKMSVVRQRLCVLRSQHAGSKAVLWSPDRLGLSVMLVTQVSLRGHSTEALRGFEAWRLAEPSVTRADLMTGRFDYQLWSCHRDWRAADAWSHALRLRPEVRAAEWRPVRVLSGHNLAGAPAFTAVETSPRRRTRRARD